MGCYGRGRFYVGLFRGLWFELSDYPVIAVQPPAQVNQLASLRAEGKETFLLASFPAGCVDDLLANRTSVFHSAD